MLTQLYNKIWEGEKIPSDWEVGQIIPIHKKGDNKLCSNYRGITLLSVPLKIYELILERRLREVIEPTLSEAQSGFRKGRSAQDHVFTLKQIMSKTIEYNKSAFFAFVDLEKAFDKAPREKIWEILKARNVPPKLLRAIKSIYRNTRNYVVSNNATSEEFKTTKGLRQGGVMSPALFTALLDEVMKRCHEKIKKLHLGFRRMKPIGASVCAFADDVVIIAGNEKDLQHNLLLWDKELTDVGMNINRDKTKVMAITNTPLQMNISIKGENIEQVSEFTYLGVVIDEKNKQDIDINNRIEKSNRLFYAINKSFISKKEVQRKTKITIFKTIYRPILTYGCETWIMTPRTKSRLEAAEMKYHRRVKGVTLRDHIRSTKIREEIGIESLSEYIEKRQLGWWGHIQRMNEDRMVKKIWEARMGGKRNRGRPRVKWDDEIAKILVKKGKSWEEAKIIARNKKEWKKFVNHMPGTTQ